MSRFLLGKHGACYNCEELFYTRKDARKHAKEKKHEVWIETTYCENFGEEKTDVK